MATAYGRLTGNRGSATRTGSKASGMTATVQTWDGALTLELDGDGAWRMYQHRAENGGGHRAYGEPIASGHVADDHCTSALLPMAAQAQEVAP